MQSPLQQKHRPIPTTAVTDRMKHSTRCFIRTQLYLYQLTLGLPPGGVPLRHTEGQNLPEHPAPGTVHSTQQTV